MFALPISMPRYKSFFLSKVLKLNYFWKKNAKFSSAGGFAPSFPLAAGGLAPDPQNSPPLQISGYEPFFFQ